MNPAATISTISAIFAIGLAIMGWRVAKAPGWEGVRWFSVTAVTAAIYALGNIATTTGASDPVVLVASRIQLAACLVQSVAWFKAVDAQLVRRPGRAERWLLGLLLLGAAASLLPGVSYGTAVTSHEFSPWHATYRDAVPTGLGSFLFVAALGTCLALLVRLGLAWRRGVDDTPQQFVALAAMLAFGINDALAASGVTSAPYLLDVGFVLPVSAMAWTYADRFVRDAEALIRLRSRLESLVEERTRDLVETQAMLHQTEKLAALGQFAAGVAHEVNNPAAVVTANLRYLADTARPDGAPPEAVESLHEALAAMQRINALVRRLVDAGRLAAAPSTAGACEVRGVARQAIEEARAQSGDRVAYALEIPDELHAGVRGEVFHQVMSALLANASQAIPAARRGQVTVAATTGEDGHVEVTVRDDGIGMSAAVLRRAFEPFFTTRGEGKGSGLGLPVARALIESHGGELRLETAPERGTSAILSLPPPV
jgi:signal transduction histidine kinase